MNSPVPDELSRLDELRRYEVLGTPPEEAFDDLASLASQICGTPAALISLVDTERCWFKSRIGVEIQEIPSSGSFCTKAISNDGLFEVPDVTADGRFAENALVAAGEEPFRFYAGAPLVTPEGQVIGTLSVLDRVPRHLSQGQRDALAKLAKQIIDRLEWRAKTREQSRRMAFQQTILDNAATAIIATTTEGIITHFNPEAEKMVGFTQTEVIGQLTPGSFHDPDELKKRAQELTREMGREVPPGFEVFVIKARAEQAETREWTYIHKDGSRLPVLLSVSALRDEQGALTGFLGIARDLTTRKRTEDALRASEARFRMMVENVKDYAILMLDARGYIATWNAGAEHIKGYREEEILGQHFSKFYPKVDVERGKPDQGLVIAAAEGRFEEEGWRIRKDGTPFMASVVITALRDETNTLRGFGKVTRDITERKLAEQRLRDSERFIRAALDALSAHIAVLDGQGCLVTKNRAWHDAQAESGLPWERTGIGQNYLLACRQAAAAGNANAATTVAHLQDMLGGQCREAQFECEYQSPQGTRWILCRFTRFAGSEQLRIVVAHEDITGIRLAQRQAETNQKQFQDLFEFAPDAVVMTNAEGLITRVNKQVEILFNYERGELIGQPVEILMPRSGRESHVTLREKYLRTAIPRAMGAGRTNLQGQRKDGSIFPVEISLSPMESADEQLVVASVRDITQRVKSEKQMRQALATLDATEDAALIFDPATLIFTYVNQGAVRQLGYTREELLTMSPLDIIHDFDEKKLRTALAPFLTGERLVSNFITRHRSKGGTDIPVETSLQLVASGDGEQRFIAIARDITERLDHEKQERRSQRLESIGTLAGGVAHDLNNALTPVLMICELMRKEYPKSLQMIDTVESSARRGAEMVRQLLTFSKGIEGERTLIQPLELLQEMERIIRSTFPKNIQFRTLYAPSLYTVMGDSTQLHQVLLNLCVNARDAMPHGGVLTIEARNEEVDETFSSAITEVHPGSYVVWQISDTGVGIPPEILERIFEPFFTTKTLDKGTGLGLSTAIGIIRSHGGLIRAHSTPGQGATFSVYLPSEGMIRNAPVQEDLEKTSVAGKGRAILVVDDEESILQATRTVLTNLDFRVFTATDGVEGLVYVAERGADFCIIISDLHMPKMDGLTFVKAVRRMLPTVEVIVTSGRFEERDEQQFRELGSCTLLGKPFTQDMLTKALEAILPKSSVS